VWRSLSSRFGSGESARALFGRQIQREAKVSHGPPLIFYNPFIPNVKDRKNNVLVRLK
jgi:hypothetical protein